MNPTDPDPQHWFLILSLPDPHPDPLVTSMDPAPDLAGVFSSVKDPDPLVRDSDPALDPSLF